MTISVRQIRAQELPALISFAKRTFIEAFKDQNSPEDIAAYTNRAFRSEHVNLEFLNPGSSFYWAQYDDQIAGYLKLNQGQAQTEQILENALEIERIYIDKTYQGQGVGQALMDFATTQAQKEQCDWIWLGVWEHNEGAIRFYERNGFEGFASHPFQFGYTEQTDLMMRKPVTR